MPKPIRISSIKLQIIKAQFNLFVINLKVFLFPQQWQFSHGNSIKKLFAHNKLFRRMHNVEIASLLLILCNFLKVSEPCGGL